MRSESLWLLVCLPGCIAMEDEGSGIHGSPRDVTTEPGAYDGYVVSSTCSQSSADIGIQGTGARWYDDVAPEDEARPDALDELAQTVVSPALEDIASVWGLGWGLGCDGVGVVVWLDDWRDVDAVIAQAGAILREQDLQEEIAVSVGGVPVAQ